MISIPDEITMQKPIIDLKEANFFDKTGAKKPMGMNKTIFPTICLRKMPNPKMVISFTLFKGIRLKVNLKSGNGKSYLICQFALLL